MQWFTSNTTLKLVSLLLAIIMWFFVKAVTTENRGPAQSSSSILHLLGLVSKTAMMERNLDVRLVLTGQLPAGYEIERTNVVPRIVRIKGPKTLVESLAVVETLPIDLTDRRVSFHERVDLALPDTDLVPINHARVEADVRIREITR